MPDDAPTRVSALGPLGAPAADPGPAGAPVRLWETAHTAKINLRGNVNDDGYMGAVAGVVGVAPPAAPNRQAAAGNLGLVWLGPDEWLLTGPAGREPELGDELRRATAGMDVSIVDVTEQRTVIEIAGARARDVLAKLSALDLHEREFGPGAAAQTRVGKAGVLILNRAAEGAEPAYALHVNRSFAAYLWRLLEDAAVEFRAGDG